MPEERKGRPPQALSIIFEIKEKEGGRKGEPLLEITMARKKGRKKTLQRTRTLLCDEKQQRTGHFSGKRKREKSAPGGAADRGKGGGASHSPHG